MEWHEICTTIKNIKTKFDKTYKCLSPNRPIQAETIKKHATTLVDCFNEARTLIYEHRETLNSEHWSKLSRLLIKLRLNLIAVKRKFSLEISIPTILNTPLTIDTDEQSESIEPEEIDLEVTESEEKYTDIEDKDLLNLTIPAILTLAEDTNQKKFKTENIMAQSNIDFLNTASKLIPDFDGKAENLTSFIDALNIVDTIKGEHESLAVSVIKTKLKGHARNLISNEQTIAAIITQLSSAVKGESVEVISAKLLSLQQKSKTANQYTQEVEKLTKALEGAYISEGLGQTLANKYSTTTAVKAMTKNCSIDKVKLIMQAGTFTNMNDAISKFVNSCTEITGQSNTVLYYRRGANNNNRGGRGYNRGRNGNNYNRGNNNSNNYNNRGGRRGRNQGRGRGNSNQGYNTNNVRVTQNTSENSQTPLGNNQ